MSNQRVPWRRDAGYQTRSHWCSDRETRVGCNAGECPWCTDDEDDVGDGDRQEESGDVEDDRQEASVGVHNFDDELVDELVELTPDAAAENGVDADTVFGLIGGDCETETVDIWHPDASIYTVPRSDIQKL